MEKSGGRQRHARRSLIRMDMTIKTALVICIVTGSVITAKLAAAQEYPVKPVRLIVPFPPGGPTDIVGRATAEALSRAWKMQIIADNRPGAGGNVGSEQCAKSAPDGYTMCIISIAQTISLSLYTKLPIDPRRDFAHVTLLATLPSLLLAHPSLPVKNVRELVTLAKTRPGALNYASGGIGTSSQLLMEMFKQYGGVNITHIPYKGTGPALVDQIAGAIEVAFSTVIAAQPYVKAGRLRALGISTRERFAPMPDVPAIDEAGLKGFDGGSWQGLVMPAGTPREIVHKINAELVKILGTPEMKEKSFALGAIAASNSPEAFTAFIKSEADKWAKVVNAAGIRGE